MKYRAKRDIPKYVKEYHTLSAKKLAQIILAKRNKEITPQSISMWFKRNPRKHEELQNGIIQKELPDLEVSETIFNNGTFEEITSVKEWLTQLDARELSPQYVQAKIALLKRMCKGQLFGLDLVKEGLWCFKHPDRLTLKEVMQFISMLKKKGHDTYSFKRDLKDFIESKGEAVGKRIVVGKPKGYGKYAKLFVLMDVLRQMLNWIKTINFEAYVVDSFMLKNGTRIGATLNALIEELTEVGEEAIITVYDKGRKSKYPKGHAWDKKVDSSLLWELKQLIGTREYGKIFSIDYNEVSRINREAMQRFCPEVLRQYPKLYVNHFWRHMFFQHILRKCKWNYTIAGSLGGAHPMSVEESYGKPPEETIKRWSDTYSIII